MSTTKGTSMDDGKESGPAQADRLAVPAHPLEVEAAKDVPEVGRRNNRAAFTVPHRPVDVDEGGVSQ